MAYLSVQLSRRFANLSNSSLLYSNPKSVVQICRGSAKSAYPHGSGQPRGVCPYNNYTIHLGSLLGANPFAKGVFWYFRLS
jgi:hypothetical protein